MNASLWSILNSAAWFGIAKPTAAEWALLILLGSVGFVLGGLMARQVGHAIFGVAITVHAALLPIVLLAAGAIVLAGSALAIRRAAQVDPVLALRGDA